MFLWAVCMFGPLHNTWVGLLWFASSSYTLHFIQRFNVFKLLIRINTHTFQDYIKGRCLCLFPTVGPPMSTVTPEGLIFVAQWVLVALICYWLISLAFRLVASTLRRALWLLKLAVALTCFGFILSDHRVGTEVMAVRLAVLLCVCVLLGVGTWGGSDAADKTAHLKEQVKILERRLKDVEKWTRTEGK